MILAMLLAAGAVADTQTIQRQLDFVVSRCRADEVVRFVAQGGNVVRMEMLRPGRLPSVSENQAFQCALAKVKERTDLRLEATSPKGKAQ